MRALGDRDAATVARERAILSGISHHVMQNSQETWIAGQGAKDNFWPNVSPLLTFNADGKITNERTLDGAKEERN